MSGICSANLVVETNGTFYLYDFYVLDQWNMGNILDENIQDLLQGEKAKEFVEVS